MIQIVYVLLRRQLAPRSVPTKTAAAALTTSTAGGAGIRRSACSAHIASPRSKLAPMTGSRGLLLSVLRYLISLLRLHLWW